MSNQRFLFKALPHPNEESGMKRITGRFFMVQSANISPQPDGNGDMKVDWPGSTIYPGTKAGKDAARQVAKALAGKYPGLGFYVMESVALFKRDEPAGKEVIIPKLRG